MSNEPSPDTTLEWQKFEAEERHRRDELDLKREDFDLRKKEINRAVWSAPIFLAIVAAILGIAGNAIVAATNGYYQRLLSHEQSLRTEELEKNRFDQEIALQHSKAEADRILQVIRTGDATSSATNLRFLLEAGLIKENATEIRSYLDQKRPLPVLPADIKELSSSVTADRLGISNAPPPEVVNNLRLTIEHIVRPIESLLGHKITIVSGYRSPELNQALGGPSASAHIEGRAIDFIVPEFGSPNSVACAIEASNLVFDQLILEYSVIYISYDEDNNRRSVLTLDQSSHGYKPGLDCSR